ncbi:MAG: Glu/Leu/Phe/Val dehydrogenase [Sandaracinaceae bacterium]
MYDFLTESTRLLRQAGELGGIDPAVIDLLAEPMRIVAFRIPLRLDDGRRRIFQAYRVRHNDALGPSRDGTRISADLDLDEVKALGLIMSIKHAAGEIPAGGGKGGIVAEPRDLSRWEYERLCRAYIRHLQPSGPDYDVPGADIGTDLQSMAWMLDEYEQVAGGHRPAAIDDKPIILGGSPGGYEATGGGVFDTTQEAIGPLGLSIDGAAIAIQGFGQVGSVAARLYAEAGARVLAVSDREGGVHRDDGLDIEALAVHAAEAGTVAGFPGGEAIGNAELLVCACDVLVPAAVQGVLTVENADRVQARLIVEGANSPTSVDADAVLTDRGITVVPDIIANSGSVHVCQMERSQGLYDNRWSFEQVEELRRERMLRAYREALHAGGRHGVRSARLGAWINALERLQLAIKTRGWL